MRRHAMRRACTLALGGALVLGGVSHRADAQGVLVRGTTTAQFLELRPFERDSVPFAQTTPVTDALRQLPNGALAACSSGEAYCRFHRAGATSSTVPLLQDLDVTAWGLGRGVSVHASVRVRGAVGSQPDLWPRVGDRVDALSAYLQLDRDRATVRAGRQFAGTGLGVYNFDGASVALRPWRTLRVEAFGGWSLLQGVNEGFTSSELAALDELPPDRNAYLVGAQLQARPTAQTSVHAAWQREVRDNRSALYSERVALDATWRARGHQLEGAWQEDIATGTTNELRLRWRLPAVRGVTVSSEVHRFRPFFELWTIWGAFSPVGFDEGRVQAHWQRADGALSFDAHGARRRWQATDAGFGFASLRTDGWRLGGAARWRAASRWELDGSYSADVGAGAARTEGDVGAHYTRGAFVGGASATAFESIYEFRVGTGRVLGLSVDGGWQFAPDLRLSATAALYRQLARNGAPSTDWTQRRATVRLDWTVGGDPGLRAARRAARSDAARAGATTVRATAAGGSR
ncbi:MAG: hypothetical protein LCH84_08245 [Gemmatimonadetes bacterium]|nr:hypothetical protein [Gemmatimonadota bacterium]